MLLLAYETVYNYSKQPSPNPCPVQFISFSSVDDILATTSTCTGDRLINIHQEIKNINR